MTSTGIATTDPDEMLEVFDAEGRPTGIAKSRAAVHRDGDWHLAFFCWIVRPGDGGPEIVLQRRAMHKDVWPGRFDASAAGHVRFGETIAEATREVEEELGIHVEPHELRHVLRHQQEHVHESGLVDREIHDVHLLPSERALDDYRPGPEVTGLVAVPMEALLALADGSLATFPTVLVTFDATGAPHHEHVVLHHDDLVPYDAGYLETLAASLAR